MGLSSFLLFFLFLFFNVLSLSVTQESTDRSAVSFTLCEGFAGEVDVRITVKPKQGKRVFARLRGETRQKSLNGKIAQKNVKHVKVISDHEICFQALVVDTTIIVDQPTNFKVSCEANEEHDTSALPCKELGAKVKPVLICPEALTKLLRENGVISTDPTETLGPRDFEPPTYDITSDMLQASSTIADGLTEGFGTIVKSRLKNLADARKVSVTQISSKLSTFSSFLKAVGPVFNVFDGIASIVTTFLTPNPFDEMAKYLKREFDEIHRRLSHLQTDINDLKKVLELQGKLLAMTPKLQAIRYSLRRYERMVHSLSKDPVCGSNNLLRRRKVKDFMRQYKQDRVEDSLLDLYGVEFGEVVEASSLLRPFMRAYCGSEPHKVERFMQEIANYAYAGSLAHFAYKSLECRKRGRQNCDNNEDEREEWLRKLYRFLNKANNLKEALVNPIHILRLEMKEGLDKVIYDEVKKAPNAEATEFPGLFDKVNEFIINWLHNPDDWPEACIVNLKNDRTVIIEVAQMSARYYGSHFKPWSLTYSEPAITLQKAKFNVRQALRGSDKKTLSERQMISDVRCHALPPEYRFRHCVITAWGKIPPPTEESKDRIIYFLFNPISYLLTHYPLPFVGVTPKVVINMFPVDVYYISTFNINRYTGDTDVKVGCWLFKTGEKYHSCESSSQRDPNRPTWDKERYFALVEE